MSGEAVELAGLKEKVCFPAVSWELARTRVREAGPEKDRVTEPGTASPGRKISSATGEVVCALDAGALSASGGNCEISARVCAAREPLATSVTPSPGPSK